MFNAIKFSASRRRSQVSVLGVLFCALAIVLLPTLAHAQCSKTWDASGVWEIREGRGTGSVVRLDLKQSGSALDGTTFREARAGERGNPATKTVPGKAVGNADGSNFSLMIDWSDMPGEFIAYKGKILASGRAEGAIFLNGSQTSRGSWYSVQPLTCGWSPGKTRGNLTSKLSADAPIKPSEIATRRQGPPRIVANQIVMPGPYQITGMAHVQWEGGPEYPNAEVWVAVNGGAQTIVAKQRAGSLQIPSRRGFTYIYYLKDAGKILSTAGFAVQ